MEENSVKKTLSLILALLLTLAMVFTLAACGGDDDGPTEAPTTVETTEEPDTVDVDTSESTTSPEASSTDDATTTAIDGTTDPNATTKPGETTVASTDGPPANLNTLSKAEQLAYFNKAVNKVRTGKPGYKKDYSQIISNLTFTGVVKAAQGIIDDVVSDLTGADPTKTQKKGDDNRGDFLSEITPYELRNSDVASISSKKSGNNWVITVKIIEETNPAKPTGSANARAYPIASRQEVLDSITGVSSAISADANKATLKYNSGNISLTVNDKGQVIACNFGFKVNAVANDVKIISIISTDVTALMTVTCKYYDFVW